MKLDIPFKVSARTARLIGRENVSKPESALIELIKNSYDADAHHCFVYIDPSNKEIHLVDNGDGMTLATIENKWMTIGTDSKLNDYLTDSGRVKVGAKGIGRFALDRLGEQCQMVTKSKNEPYYQWNVDWNEFDVKRTISQVNARVTDLPQFSFIKEISRLASAKQRALIELDDEERLGELENFLSTFKTRPTGTYLKIVNIHDDDGWKDFDFNALYENLQSLIPPFENNSFRIMLIVSKHPEEFGEVFSVITDDYDYKLDISVRKSGEVEVAIDRNEFDIDKLEDMGFFNSGLSINEAYQRQNFENKYHYTTRIENLVPGASEKPQLRVNLSKVGPFSFSFYFLKRGYSAGEKGTNKYPYKKFNGKDRINWLNEFGGVKIYRDKFRVRPYGEVGSSAFDWLGLGRRAVKNPTVTRPGYKVRPNQVVGVVNISRVYNRAIEDTSSREGLQENEIFFLFKRILEEMISIFEVDRNKIMIALKKIYDANNDREQKKKEANDVEEKEAKKIEKDEDKQKLIDAIKVYKEEAEELKHDQRIMRALASTGLIITSFTHEFAHLKRKMSSRTRHLKNAIQNILDEVTLLELPEEENPIILAEDIRRQDKRLKSWLDFTIAAVRKDKRSRKKINLVDYVNQFEKTWNSLLSERKVSFLLQKGSFQSVYFNGFEIDLDSILNNLISNSIDAFRSKQHTGTREIIISFSLTSDISILYEDSGPGLSKDIIDPEQIFEPFFTTKTDKSGVINGTGLGMYIVKSIIDDYKGKIIFHKIRPGFKIEINLPYIT